MNIKHEIIKCIDDCCEFQPLVIITKNIKIDCMNCVNVVFVKGITEKDQLKAMIKWNKKIRSN